jgi:DNA topoisomerase-1
VALEMLEQASQAEQPLGTCPDTNKLVYVKTGRFGPYVQRGASDDDEKQNASLLKGMKAEEVDLVMALKLLSLPRELGPHPTTSEVVMAYNGRFGPYVKSGSETRSLPAGLSPIDVTLVQALELLAQPKQARRGFGAPREPLKELGVSPVTQQKIQVLEGRYGLYVADGVTNATLPKGQNLEELTVQQALDLLAERAARGPSPKAARKLAAKKAAAAKSGGAKKPAKGKKSPAKKKASKRAAKKTSDRDESEAPADADYSAPF